ncbi:MAG: glycine--tRNA ligase subunit beta [Alphaproteobacteria bacterium]|nr:glycine--tRNA ligase subunit beta [Alphaproteobacteria bacterium]
MPQLLLEILSEEIPARMQARAQADLERALMDKFTAAGLLPAGVKGFSGPRRLTAVVEGLAVRTPDVSEDIPGPREGAPEAAIQGFLRKAGLASIDQAHIHDVPKKGRIYVAHVRRPGRATTDLIAEMIPSIIREFHWPKSMRWGDGDLRWVRPISRILCTFDGEVVPFEVGGIVSGDLTEGHRVMGRGPFRVRRFEDYEDTLRNRGQVILDRDERKEMIAHEARTLCQAQALEWVEDPGLLEEVAGLAEYPVVLIGDMDPAFLDLPPEVIRLSMRTHQKYFAVRDPRRSDGGLAPKFIVTANLLAADGGARIAQGNARVLSARLNDARFFWDNDRRIRLEDRFDRLGDLVYHERLGSVRDKAERTAGLAQALAARTGVDPETAARAARLAKCDLVSDMVGEFPELEGVMGRYYARLQGAPEAVADAIRDHYRPKGPGEAPPVAPLSATIALADKLDTLAGFWAIDETPTGSKDPYALRRAALGVIRIILEGGFRLSLGQELALASGPYSRLAGANAKSASARQAALMAFLADRLKVYLREQGVRHDLIDAVFSLGEDDLVSIVRRVEALGRFLDTEDGGNLLAGYRRAANILKAEEKKDGRSYSGIGQVGPDDPPEARVLSEALGAAAAAAGTALDREDYSGAMQALSGLRGPVDAFFARVTVNVEDVASRAERLKLLSQIRDALGRVADFSKIEG